MGGATRLSRLLGQIRQEEKLEALRIRRRSHNDSLDARISQRTNLYSGVHLKTEQSAKWWSLDGAIVGGALASVLANLISKLLGLS